MTDLDLSTFAGMRREDAILLLKSMNLEYRVIRFGVSEWHTSDQRPHRVNLRTREDVVVDASFG